MPLRTWIWVVIFANFVVAGAASLSQAEAPDYQSLDPQLKTILLDSSPNESFLSMRADTSGRLFVGGREALFVYEPDGHGGFAPRKELYRFPNHTWVYDIAIRGHDVYVMTVSALYVLPGAVTAREGIKPVRLIWGVPLGHVHQCFHGLAWGPEGDLYFSMGDPLWYYGDFKRPDHWGHWTFFSRPEGKVKLSDTNEAAVSNKALPLTPGPSPARGEGGQKPTTDVAAGSDSVATPYNGVGGVFRCRPDGSRFQIVSRGLRNSVGLCFDRHWNLFTNDNDHEGMPAQYVPGRLVHVTPHTYFNWPRGWMVNKTPNRADLLETMSDNLGRYVPVGQCYYDDTYLPEEYRNNLLVARWCILSVTRYPLAHRGASFKATEEQHVLDGQNMARPVGIAVGLDGRLFATIAYMAQNEGSPTYRSDLVMISRKDEPKGAKFEPYDAVKASGEKLWSELSNPSWSRQYAAFVELMRRGPFLVRKSEPLKEALARKNDPSLEHRIWFAAANDIHMMDSAAPPSAITIKDLIKSDDPKLRLQAIRAANEYLILSEARTAIPQAINDPNDQVRHAAVLAQFSAEKPAFDEVIAGPARSTDTYLRQASVLLLAERAPLEKIKAMCEAKDSPGRLAGVLAAGFRLTLPGATSPIPDNLPLAPLQSDAAYVIQYADEKVDLRKFGRVGNFTVADHWKAGPHTPEQEELFALLMKMLKDDDPQIAYEAAHFLSVLRDPRSEPAVIGVFTATEKRRIEAAEVTYIQDLWLAGPFSDGGAGFDKIHPPEQGVVDLSATYTDGGKKITWQEDHIKHHELASRFGAGDDCSYYAYFRLESAGRVQNQLLLGSDDGVKVWQNGRLIWTNDDARKALPCQDTVVVNLQPGGNDFLVRVRNRGGDFGFYAHHRVLDGVAAQMPDKVGLANLAERLAGAAKQGNQTAIASEFLSVDWPKAIAQGKPAQGRKVFEAAGCIKCHAVKANADTLGGPSLADANRRFTVPYLVESILAPSKQLSPVFRATLITTKDGHVVNGLVVGETEGKVELLQPDTKRVSIEKRIIEERKLQDISPMPTGLVKTPEELRDLVAYLMAVKSD